jgi:hypothetical protein
LAQAIDVGFETGTVQSDPVALERQGTGIAAERAPDGGQTLPQAVTRLVFRYLGPEQSGEMAA